MSRSRKSSAKVARNNCKFPGNLARRAQRNCLKSASMRCVNRRTSLQLLTNSDVRPNAKKYASGVDVTQILGQTGPKLARRKCKISGIPARRAHKKLRAFGQQPLRMLKNCAEVDRVDNAFHIEKARVRRRDHANVAPKSRGRNANFLKKFGAPRAQKIACTRPACAAPRMTSSKLFTKS